MLAFIVVGLVVGSLYGAAGMSLVLVYRATGVFNLANGAVGALSAYLFYDLHTVHGLAWPWAVSICVVAFGAVAGVLLEFAFRPLAGRPPAMGVVATVGLLLLTEGALYLQFGNDYLPFPSFLPSDSFTVDEVQISAGQVITFAVGAVATAGLYAWMKYSRTGLAMRAVVNDAGLVALLGIGPASVRRIAWSVGSAFAGLVGILLAPTVNLDAKLLSLTVVTALGAAALGLYRSLPMTYLGGLVLGVAQSLLTKYFVLPPWNALPSSLPFAVLIVVLVVGARWLPSPLVRPLAAPAAPNPLDALRARIRRAGAPVWVKAVPYVVLVAALAVVPHLVGYNLPLYANGLVLVLVFASLGLLVTSSSQISLCHAAFVAVGAATLSHLTTGTAHLPWLPALLISGLTSAVPGAIVAICTVRLPGIYLALATFGFAILMQNLVYPSRLLFGSQLLASVDRPVLGFVSASDASFYYVLLVIVGIGVAIIGLLRTGWIGRRLAALSDAPRVLDTTGVNANSVRLVTFTVSAYFAGLAGGLLVTLEGSLSGSSLGATTSLLWIAVLAIGGKGLLSGAIMPAAAIAVLPHYLTFLSTDVQTTLFGAGALLIGIGAPQYAAAFVGRHRPAVAQPAAPAAEPAQLEAAR